MKGAHKNLRVYDEATSDRNPMERMLTPSEVAQACNVPLVKASGRPDEKPSRRRGNSLW
jgi:hypothetical protein